MLIKRISLEVSNLCNLKCGLCGRDQSSLKTRNLTPEAIENLNLDIFDMVVTMFGRLGDPMFNPYILDITKIFKKTDTTVSIGTNGTMKDDSWWYDYARLLPKKHLVSFAIDGTDSETYSYYRKGGSFNNVIANMKAFIKGGGNASWQFIIFKHNQHQINDLERMAKEYGCLRFNIIPSNQYNKVYQRPTKYYVKSNDEARDMATIRCRMSLGEIFVACTGYYHPCCLIVEFSTVIRLTKAKLKSIYTTPLKSIIESGYYDEIFNRINGIDFCKKCNVICGQRFVSDVSDIENGLSQIGRY